MFPAQRLSPRVARQLILDPPISWVIDSAFPRLAVTS